MSQRRWAWSFAAVAFATLVAGYGFAPSGTPTPNIRATIQAAGSAVFPTATATALSQEPGADATVQAGKRIQTSLHAPTPTPGLPERNGDGGPPPFPDGLTANVVRVVDGDTVDIVFENGSTARVRLPGVDAPEIFSENSPGEYGDIRDTTCLDRWGRRAAEFAAESLEGRVVWVIPGTGTERDTAGRLLAFIHVDGRDFNAVLVEQGYARVYTVGESQREDDYLRLQDRARAQRAGLWQCASGNPTPVHSVRIGRLSAP